MTLTLLASENLSNKSTFLLMSKLIAKLPNLLRLATRFVEDLVIFSNARPKLFCYIKEKIMIVINNKIWETTKGIKRFYI